MSMRGRMRAAMARVWRILGRNDSAGYLDADAVPDSSDAPGGTVTIEDERPEALRLRVSTPAPTVVVVRDTFFAGWRASVDGVSTPVWRADLLFRAVPVPAGDHVVEMTYRQATYEIGRTISLVAIAIAAALLTIPQTAARLRAWPPAPLPIHAATANSLPVSAREEPRVGVAPPNGHAPSTDASATPRAVAGEAIGNRYETSDTEAVDRQREGAYLDDDSTLGGLYIASRDTDPEVARESVNRHRARPTRADADASGASSSDDTQ